MTSMREDRSMDAVTTFLVVAVITVAFTRLAADEFILSGRRDAGGAT